MSYRISLFLMFIAFGINLFNDHIFYENKLASKIDKYNSLNKNLKMQKLYDDSNKG